MKNVKRIFVIIFMLAFILSISSINAFAATVTQDNLEVTLVTDKEKYSENEQIKTTLTVKNNNDTAVTNVDLETALPDGYKLADKSENKKTVDSIAAGESVSLDVTLEKDNTKKESTPSEPSTDAKSSTNPVSGGNSSNSGNSGTTTGGTTTNGSAIQTGQGFLIVGIIMLVLLASGVTLVYIYRKKQRVSHVSNKILSLVLCIGIIASTLSLLNVSLKSSAAEEKKQVEISTHITLNNSEMEIKSKISYDYSQDSSISVEVIPTYGGTVNNASGTYKPGDTIELEATPDAGWSFSNWEVKGQGEIAENKNNKTTFKVSQEDVTIIARFINNESEELTNDELDVYLAYSALSLGFSEGDYEESVTRDINLENGYGTGEHKVDISWNSSDDSIISNNGNVSRPTDNDTYITLTATLNKNSARHSKEFRVRVIKVSATLTEDIEDKSLIDLQKMNENSEYPLEIEYNDDETQVEFISGQFSEITVNSVESALQSICSVRSLIGLENPSDELEWKSTNHSDSTLAYSFKQMYKNIPVYGSAVTVSADPIYGKTLSLSSSVIPTDILQNVDFQNILSIEDVKNKYDNQFSILKYVTVIYSLNNFKDSPIIAYVISTENKTIIISAQDGEIIDEYSKTKEWGDYSTTGSGQDELGNNVSFPVQFHQWDWWFFYQEDVQRRIYLHGDNSSAITHEFNTEWKDKTANSAYTNVIKVYDWYKTHLNRNSIDNYGMAINVNVHNYKNEKNMWGSNITDNAHWDCDNNEMCFFENSAGGTPTTAAGLDIIAHEMTHGVFQYSINQTDDDDFPYSNYTGSINEGYADVFGYFVDDSNWTIGESWNALRSLSNPESHDAPSKINGTNYIINKNRSEINSNSEGFVANSLGISVDRLKHLYQKAQNANSVNSYDEFLYEMYQSNLVHTNSSLIYHSAYLMQNDGISKNRLEKIWYDSMSLGYYANSNYHTVRRNLIQAAKNNHASNEELKKIRKAFDDEEIFDEKGSISIKFVDEDGNDFSEKIDGSINLQRIEEDAPQAIIEMDTDTFASTRINDIYFGTYKVKANLQGYLNFESNVKIITGKTTELVIPLIKAGDGTVRGTITSATTGYPVDSVLLNVYHEWNQTGGSVVSSTSTDENGTYSLTLPAGYYTVEMSKDGYATGYFNLTISGGKTINNKNASISPIMTFGKDFRVVLTWGANPSDLDSHLFGRPSDGSSYHIYYSNKNGYDSNGNKIANLDVDDTTSFGPETTTFSAETGGSYEYYIDWYAGSGTWATCGGKVEVYNGARLMYVFNVPSNNTKSGSWKVFTFKNGIFNPVNVIQSEDIY